MGKIADLEWANYAASLSTAQVTPGLEVILREDLILTSSATFPTPDVNHACLLRTTVEKVDPLIDEVVSYFQTRELQPAIFVSPACAPEDLPQHLQKRGFIKQDEKEAWMVLALQGLNVPDCYPTPLVRQITKEEALTFAEVFMASFEIPIAYAPAMAQILEPSIKLPGTHHYIAFLNEQPVGTCSLIRYKNIGILGSAGVLPSHRRSGAITNLTINAITEAQKCGLDTLVLQTADGTLLERLLRISGFKKVFTRNCYIHP